MSKYYSDPTANMALSAVEREWKAMQKKADRLGALRRKGMLSAEAEAKARRQFTGIYRRMLADALAE